MPWCPNCKSEYRPGFTHCSDCGAELADALPAVPEAEPLPQDDQMPHPRLLTSIVGQMELGMVVNLLEGEGIRVLLRDAPAGSFIRSAWGYCVEGQRLYVDEARLEDAKALLEACFSRAPEEPDSVPDSPGTDSDATEAYTSAERSYLRRRKVMRVIIWLMLLSPVLAILFILLVTRQPAVGYTHIRLS